MAEQYNNTEKPHGVTFRNNNRETIPFSEALERTGFGPFNYLLIFIVGLIFANIVFETASVGYVLPVAECDLNLTNKHKGILSAIGFIGIIVSSHFWGFLADTKGRRCIIVPSLVISYLITLLSSFSYNFYMLVALRFLNGFFICGASASIFAYIAEFHTDRLRSKATLASGFIFSLFMMMLPLIAWAVFYKPWTIPLPFLGINYKPWRLYFVACGTPGILCAIVLYWYPESPKFLMSVGKKEEAIEVLKTMYKWNVGKGVLEIDDIISEKSEQKERDSGATFSSSNFVYAFLHTVWNQTIPVFQKNLLRSSVLICTIQFWLFVTSHGLFMSFPYIIEAALDFINNGSAKNGQICDMVYAKLANSFEEDGSIKCPEKLENRTYMYSFAMEVLFSSGFVVSGFVEGKVKKTHLLFVMLAGCGTSGLISVLIKSPKVAMYAFMLLFVSGVGVQVLGGITAELYPTNLRGMALSISLMFGRLGGVVAANFVGFFLDNNCEITIFIPGAALIICGFLSFLLPRKTF